MKESNACSMRNQCLLRQPKLCIVNVWTQWYNGYISTVQSISTVYHFVCLLSLKLLRYLLSLIDVWFMDACRNPRLVRGIVLFPLVHWGHSGCSLLYSNWINDVGKLLLLIRTLPSTRPDNIFSAVRMTRLISDCRSD